jgi:hypothetical protein
MAHCPWLDWKNDACFAGLFSDLVDALTRASHLRSVIVCALKPRVRLERIASAVETAVRLLAAPVTDENHFAHSRRSSLPL